jgi:hypothetical protein
VNCALNKFTKLDLDLLKDRFESVQPSVLQSLPKERYSSRDIQEEEEERKKEEEEEKKEWE